MRFWEEMARPASVFGPVESLALARLAVSCASEMGVTGLVSGRTIGSAGAGSGFGLGGGEASFAGELAFVVRGGTAFFAVHGDGDPFSSL